MRKPRPGETWGRGNDLPDGKFGWEVFVKILGGIVFYEAKDVVKDRVDVPVSEEATIPTPEASLELPEEFPHPLDDSKGYSESKLVDL